MVFFLIFDVVDNGIQLRMGITECGESLLPHKFSRYPSLSVNESCGAYFDVSHQIREGDVGSQPHKDMNVVGHRVDLHHLLFFVLDKSGDILMEFRLVFFGD